MENSVVTSEIRYDLPPEVTFEQALAELDGLIGMESIKKEIRDLANSVKAQKERFDKGLVDKVNVPHIILTGNPGTGKTTLARLLGQVMMAIGVLPTSEVVETSAGDFVAGYVGQTSVKTEQLLEKAVGKVLFIDEAYKLALDDGVGSTFGDEAIAQLMIGLSNWSGRFMCIAAGYRADMERFIDVNPGMARRFPERWHIEDYGPGELHRIFRKFAEKEGYVLSKEADEKARETVRVMHEDRDPDRFGNAGDVENVWRKAKERHGNRISALPDAELKKEILPEDLP